VKEIHAVYECMDPTMHINSLEVIVSKVRR